MLPKLGLQLLVGFELDVLALDVDEHLRVHRLDRRGHRKRPAHLAHHPDDALTLVLAGRRADVAGPAVLVLQEGDVVRDLLVSLVHAEVVVGQAQIHLGLDPLGNVQKVCLHVVDRVGEDLGIAFYARVAERAGERAPAGDLHHREVAGAEERIHHPREVG